MKKSLKNLCSYSDLMDAFYDEILGTDQETPELIDKHKKIFEKLATL